MRMRRATASALTASLSNVDKKKEPDSMKKRILVISSANMDMTMPIVRVPEGGETLIAEGGVVYTPGGKGANSAVGFAKLGGDCVFCTCLGCDSHGETLYDYYKECGIDVSHIRVDREAKTGFAVIMVDRAGQNRILCYPGANAALTEEDVEEAFLSCPDGLYMQLELPREIVMTAAAYARERDIPIFLDAGPATPDFPLEELPPLEVFSPNESETEIFTGIRPFGTDSCLAACHALAKRVKAKYIVLKLGDRGAFVYDGRHIHSAPSFPVHAVDTTAAGDAFTAALTLRYLEGDDITEAATYANAVGAITVSRAGASYTIPTAAEVAEFLQKHR